MCRPARVTHSRVTLNGRDLGLYVVVEAMNQDFLMREFGNSKGNLYEGDLQDIDQALEQDNGNDRSRGDLRALLEATRESELSRRIRLLQERLDVERFLTYAATEVFLGHRDGYFGRRNNYRIYHDAATARMVFVPHGLDVTFITGIGAWSLTNNPARPGIGPAARPDRKVAGAALWPDTNSIVAAAVLEIPALREQYYRQCAAVFTNVWRLDWMTNRVNAAVSKMLTVARTEKERDEWLRLGRIMCARVQTRHGEILSAFPEPQP